MGNSRRSAGIVSPGLVKTNVAPIPPAQEKPEKQEKPDKDEKVRTTCLHSQLHKTKLCSYHLKGNCQYGSSCAFAHSCTELQATPDLRKTRLCINFTEGEGCTDPECPFAHGKEELRSTDMFYKKTLCIWNEKGKCRNGDQCRFAHGIGELRASLQQAAVKTKSAKGHAEKAGTASSAGKQQRRPKAVMPGGNGYGSGQAEPMKVLPHSSLIAPGMPTGTSMSLPQGAMQAELETLRNHISALSLRCSEIKFKQSMMMPENAQLDAASSQFGGDWCGSVDMVNTMNAKVAAMLLGGSNGPMDFPGVGQMIPVPPGFGDKADQTCAGSWQNPPVFPAMGA